MIGQHVEPFRLAGRKLGSLLIGQGVNVAFVSAATVNPVYAEMLREGYARLLAVSRAQLRAAEQAGELAEGIDPDREAAALYFLAQGLIAPVLIGLFSAEDALGLLSHQLDRIFR